MASKTAHAAQTAVAAVLFALGWMVGVLCASVLWVGLAVKVGWQDGWSHGGAAR